MNFAFDYDGCANADVPTFIDVISTLQKAGHKVFIVTMRYPSECRQVIEDFSGLVDGIIPTSRKAKRADEHHDPGRAGRQQHCAQNHLQ